ncbi:hypothetical protein ES754_03530 [Psychrobacter frigidicola]|uniref:Uncharacterized protein n=1 Tax=Psychrobacter frigidicola TaxID=45611 RepID=A0A5C7A6D3_9GAMM|nr:hypothetical protein [Psychrobacter frigidicola]TXD98034.1 hypothetical protein ES754_03530 [Psychrobacter frigidicola]
MTNDEKKATVTSETKINIDTIREWLIRTTRMFARFALILAVLGTALVSSIRLHLPFYLSYAIVLIISAVLFIMLVIISIENIVYKYLKKSIWGQIVIYLLVALISALSYLWAIGEINRIFLVDASNLALTSTLLTAIQFFKYAVMALLSSYFIAIGLYFFYRKSDSKVINSASTSDSKQLNKKIIPGVLFVVTVVACLLSVGKISKYSDTMIQAFALKVDFYSYHTCTGADFKDIEGVLFLSASDILVAKKVEPMTWEFKKVKCEP